MNERDDFNAPMIGPAIPGQRRDSRTGAGGGRPQTYNPHAGHEVEGDQEDE